MLEPQRVQSARILALLLLAYIFNFVDRQIIGVLAVPIQGELGLSDRQLGLMGGIAFALFYSTLAVPIAWLADRRGRAATIAIAVAVWSLFTAACGLAQNFAQLFVARMGVGLGEAGGVAPSHSLIADVFPIERRARALAVYSLGIPIGSALGIAFGGWIAAHINWRAAFVIVGLAGLPVAVLIRLLIPEPRRSSGTGADAPRFAEAFGALAGNPSFWLLSMGAAAGSILGYGLIFWLPSFFSRSLGLGLGEVAWFYGSITLVGGMAGVWIGGALGDRLGADRPGAYALIPAACLLIAGPVYAAALFAPSLATAWPLFALAQMLGLAWLGPVIAAVQRLVEPAIRASASAAFLLINNLVGIGAGIWLFGEMSMRMTASHGDEALRYSILYGTAFYGVAALFYLAAARRLGRDVAATA